MPKKTEPATKVRGRPTKRAPIDRTTVLQTALALADEGGIESLSMRKLAQAVGVEAMSLYNHVAHKDDLLDGLVELVVGEIELPSTTAPWKEAMRRRALSAHTVLMRHSWATMLFVSRMNIGPAMLTYVDRTIGCLRAAGFTYPQADYAWNALDAYTYGFTLQRLNFPLEPSQYASAAAEFLPMIPAEQFPHLNGMAHEVIAGTHDGLQPIELGLDLLLDGFEALLPAPPSRSSRRRQP